ncbi:MAG: LytTR family DNA-binding domain-containing protein [Flavobacteriaceae bacterium]
MTTAVVIDDDNNLRNGLKVLLTRYAPEIQIVGEAENVNDAISEISLKKPQVVFLDIQLNDGTGFDILEKITEIEGKIAFQVVFITAHEQYAIKAFRFSALDFLLKPIDPEELHNVVKKIKTTLQKNENFGHIELLLENIRKRNDNFKRIALSSSDGIHLFNVNEIIRCESEDNYTKFYLKDKRTMLISRTLKEYEELLAEHGFERIHQSHLINLTFLKSYIKKDGGYIVMEDGSHLPVSQRKKERLAEILKAL